MKEKKILHKHVFFFGLLIGGGLFFYSFFTFNKSTAIAANQCTISDETNACAEVSSYLDCPSIDGNEEDCTNSDAGSRSCWDATDGLFKCRSSAYFAALPKPAGSNLKFDCLAGANSYKKGDTILSSEKITCNWYAVQAICDSDITTTTGGAVIDSTTNNFTKASGKWNDGSADYASCNWDDTSTDTDEAGTQPACSSKKDDGSDGVVDGVAYGVAETDPGEQSCSRSKISSVACTVESGKDPITQKKACRKCTVGAPAWGTGTEYSLVSEEECPENGKVVSLTRIFTRKVGISDCGPYKVEDSSITCAASCGTPDINTNDENYVAGEGYGYTCGKWSDCQISETGKQSRTCERAGYCSSAKTLTQERTCIAADKCEPQNTRDDAQGTDGKTYYTCNEWDASACRADVDERESIKRQCERIDKRCAGRGTINVYDFPSASAFQTKSCLECKKPATSNAAKSDNYFENPGNDYRCEEWSSCQAEDENQTRQCIKKSTAKCYGIGTDTRFDIGSNKLTQFRRCGNACSAPDIDTAKASNDDYNACLDWTETACKAKESAANAKTRTCAKKNLNCKGDDTLTQNGPCRVCTPPAVTPDANGNKTTYDDYKCADWSFCPVSGTDQARNCVKWIDDSKSNCWGLGVPISVVSGSAPLQQTRNTSCTVACVVPPTSGNSNTSYTCDGWNPAQCVLKDQGQDPQTRICTRANRNCVGDSSEDTTIDPSNPRKLRQSKDCAKCTTDSYSQCSDDATTQTNVCPNPSDGRTVERTGCIKFDCKESGSAEISTPTYTCDDETSVGSGSGFPPAVANATLRFIGSPTKKWRADTFLYNSGLQIGIGAGAIAPATILEISNAFDTSKTTQVRITDKNANPELQFQYGDGNAHWGLYVKNGSGEDKSLRFWNAKDLVKIDTDGKLHAEEFCIGADKTKCTKVWGSGGGSSQWSDITGGGIYYTGGNVGIGTKPTAETVGLLQIAKTGDRYSGIVFQESRLRLGLDNKNNSAIFAQGGDAELEVGAQGHISFTTGGIAGSATERMRINDKGNVGIGTTTPADLLTLSGTGKFVRVDENSTGNSGIVVSLNSTNKGFFGVTGAANGFITGSAVGDVVLRTQSQKLLISTDGGTTANLIVGTTGNVGIGTAEPTINGGGLEISRVGQVAVRVSDTENGGKKAEFGADSAGGFIQTLSDGANLRFFTGNALGPRIVIDSEGKVGIGTTTPAYKLDVNGNINTSNQLCIKGDCRDWGSISSASAQNFVHKTDTLGTNTNGTNAVNCGGAEDDWSSCNYGKAPIIWTQEIQVRPDGITGAVGKLFQTGGSGGDYRTQLHTASHGMADVRGKTFTFSFWVKPSVDTTIQSVFRRAGDKDTFASNTCGLTANTWKRCILTGTAGTVDNSSLSDNSALHVYLNINSEVSYYVYGAQLESGSIATAYQPKGPNTYENGYFGGNVGIGTTSPGAKLDVAGNVNVSGNVSSTGLCINGDCKTAWGEISNVGEKPRALLISYATWYPNEGSNDPDKGAPTWTWLKKNNYFSVADVDISLNADQLAAKDYDIYIIDNYAWSVGNASSKAYDLWKKYGKNVITIGNDSDTGTYPITGYIEWNKNTWGSTSGYASSADANHIITRNYRSATNIGDYGDTGKIITSVSSEFIALYKKTGDPTKITGIIGESERGGIWFHDQTGYLTGTSNGQKILGNVISYMSGSNLEMLRNRVANIGERNIQNVLYTDQKNLRVGIGTTTPEKILHINGSGNNGLLVSAAGKNTKISLHIADRDYGYLNLGGSGVTATEIRGNGQSSNFGGNIYVNGTIQATEFKIGTSTVIDSTGKWKGDPTGLQGPPGMVWKGEWKKDINYKINDVVFCDYSSWIAIQNNDGKIAPPSCGGAPTEGAPSKGTTPIWGGGVGIQPSKPALGGGTFATKRITDSNGTGGANASSNNNKAWEYWNLLAKRGDPGQPGINGVSPFMTGTNRDIYYTGGNVGIGTTTPAYKLDVNGNMQITGNFVSKGEISVSSSITQYTKSGNAIRGTGNPECSFTIKDTSPEDIYTGNSTDGDWCYYNYRGRRSKFKQLFQVQIQVKKTFFTLNGSVGIGTATPGATLDIVGNRGDVNNRNFKVTYPGGNLDGTELSGLTHLESELKMGWTALYAKKGSANYAGVFNGDIIVKNGKLGINTTNPLAMLDVNGGEINVSALDRGLLSAVDPKQKLALSRDRIGLDVAELYETSEDVEVGDVLVIGEKDKKLEKSSKSYQGEIVGIVSGSPALLFEGSDLKLGSKPDRFIRGTKPPVALAGRVPVKVSLENGPIHSGDYLTSSSIAGVAMRATEPGNTVGVALENYSGWGDGTVLVFVNIGEKNTSAAIKELQKTNQDLQKRLDEIEKKVR